ncbi:MAG: DUF3667 domain-containing protein [Ginsengibacter sp.]
MSHLPQRKEKNCLNCGTHVMGHFCHNCGQENIEPKESVWHLVSHFFQDITHFDGKFFTSLKDLIIKPGFLSKEYMIGRRVRYLNPIRMYLFTSAIFFLIFFSLYTVNEKSFSIGDINGKTFAQIKQMDSATFSEFTMELNSGKKMNKEEFKTKVDSMDAATFALLSKKIKNNKIVSRQEVKASVDTMDPAKVGPFTQNVTKGLPMSRAEFNSSFENFTIAPGNYRSKKEYDSLLKSGAKKHNWLERQMVYKNIELKEKYGSDSKLIMVALVNRFMHTLPQMLFVLLPLFALILKLVYVRRKQFYYVDHVIFTIHLYIFVFLVMLVTFGIGKLKSILHWGWLSFVSAIFVLGIFFYFYKALRNFYKQRRAKTILKYVILLLMFFFTTALTFVIFFFFSIFGL